MTIDRSSRAALWFLFLGSLLTALNFYDRYVISIVVQDIKGAFALSDSQIGLLSGLAFAVVYSLASIPVARYADRDRHARVLGLSALIWSAMSGACGFATGFWTLLLARFGVGLGESGGAPTTQALVARRFSPRWRGTAFGVIGVAGATGAIVALSGGGTIAHLYGWRTVFYAGAVTGIPIALVLLLTVRDSAGAEVEVKPAAIPFSVALRTLVNRRAYLWTCAGLAFATLGPYGLVAWMPAYLMRQFHLDSQQVGATYAVSVGIATLIGVVLGGVIGDWLNRRDSRAPLYLLIASFGITAPLQIAVLLSNDYAAVLTLVIPQTVIAMLWVSPTYALIQALSGRRLGATGAAVYAMLINLIGQGLGPSLAGWLSDMLAPSFGEQSLRYALIIEVCSCFPGVIAFLIATRTAREDIAEASRD
jgi:MFS family permease